jgi:small subunit ribosomal protein S27Ae
MAKAAAVAKARVGLYGTKGDTLTRTHKFCPKCGSGTFLAEHANRRSCGKCGYSESKAPSPAAAPPALDKGKGKGGKPAPP